MSQDQLQGYGGSHIEDTDESLRSKQGGRFGLNTPAFLTRFAYRPAEGESGEAIEIFTNLNGKEFKVWISPITQVYVKAPAGQQGTVATKDFSTPEAIKAYNEELTQHKAVITHVLKAVGVSEEAIKTAALQPANSFAEYAQRMVSLVPADYTNKPLDLFLEYQMQPGKDQSITFLQMPKNMKGGYFLIPAQPGTWTEAKDDKGGLVYKNAQGAEHPFTRDKGFLDSRKGYQTDASGNRLDGSGQAAPHAGDTPMSASQAGNGAAKQSTWNTQG